MDAPKGKSLINCVFSSTPCLMKPDGISFVFVRPVEPDSLRSGDLRCYFHLRQHQVRSAQSNQKRVAGTSMIYGRSLSTGWRSKVRWFVQPTNIWRCPKEVVSKSSYSWMSMTSFLKPRETTMVMTGEHRPCKTPEHWLLHLRSYTISPCLWCSWPWQMCAVHVSARMDKK